jgi:NADH-quinone oxidoreductase subunit H
MSGVYADPVGHWVIVVAAMLLLVFVLLTAAAYTVWLERVALGRFQSRPGPNRVGPYGLMQLAADGVKLITKESFMPAGVDKVTYLVAPGIAVAAAFLVWSVVPVGYWYGLQYWIADLNIGILLVFAIGAMNVYAIMLGGYSSNSKYSLLGGLRAAAQLISYEIALGLALVPIFIIVGSLRLQDIALFHLFGVPFPLVLLAPLSFLIYLMAAVAETNRAPFDLPEAEQELTGGYLTEYSGAKFVMFYLAEYLNMITQSALVTVLFLGAWWLPLVPPFLGFLLKVLAVLFVFIWLRATLPRLRYDMLMRLGWKVLLPLAILNVIITAVVAVAVGS